jgi:SAM-dependent methyltransferase
MLMKPEYENLTDLHHPAITREVRQKGNLVVSVKAHSMSRTATIPYSPHINHSVALYKATANSYRQGDGSDHYSLSYFRDKLATMTSRYHRPLAVLDLGCGTGRYFHCFKQAASITGVDVSPEMLDLAQRPYRQEEVTADLITLIHSDLHAVTFPPRTFDFICSIGVLGLFVPLTAALCGKIADWLTPGGTICLYVLDAATPRTTNWKREWAKALSPYLPTVWQEWLYHRLGNFSVTEPELRAMLGTTNLTDINITPSRNIDPDQPTWKRMFFLVQATR